MFTSRRQSEELARVSAASPKQRRFATVRSGHSKYFKVFLTGAAKY